MNILVTGGAGFIGSHVVDRYLEEGHSVVVIDLKDTYLNPDATYICDDIRTADIASIIKKHKIDVINHHAAQISVPASIKDPAADAEHNILGTVRLIEAAAKCNIKRFINISSAAVFDPDATLPLSEDANKAPISPYGISKLAAERYTRILCKNHGLSYVTLRYANVFGPRQDTVTGGVIAVFIARMKKNQEVRIFGDGEQTRDFIYVKDIAKANMLAHELPDGLYNVGSGKEIKINKMFEIAKDITDYDEDPIYADPRPGDLPRSVFDISKLQKHGFSTDYTFVKGVKDLSQNT